MTVLTLRLSILSGESDKPVFRRPMVGDTSSARLAVALFCVATPDRCIVVGLDVAGCCAFSGAWLYSEVPRVTSVDLRAHARIAAARDEVARGWCVWGTCLFCAQAVLVGYGMMSKVRLLSNVVLERTSKRILTVAPRLPPVV